MRIKGAMTVLKQEMEMMGMNINELLEFIQKNPLAVPQKTLEAYRVYKGE